MAWNSASELYAKWYWQDYLLECNILKSKSAKKFKVQEQTKVAPCRHLQGTRSLMVSWL